LTDLGRARAIRLAVLIDRGGRELPIQPDFVGLKQPHSQAKIHVRFQETDGEDNIISDADSR
jgi:pyrimidine operon attenuation protein/uracil phosphoribosyltransferase